MKHILTGALAALITFSAQAATLMPIQLLSPAGSTSGQVITSSGTAAAPAWTTLTGLGGLVAANNLSDVANAATALANLGGGAKSAPLSQFATTTSGQLAGILADETGSGVAVFNVAPALTNPVVTGGTIDNTVIGGTTPAFGNFTRLVANGNDALLYTNTSGQSIPNATSTTITGWTKISDRLNVNFNASTGVFTAPVTGLYMVSGQVTFGTAVNAIGNPFLVNVVANGALAVSGLSTQQGPGTVPTIITIPATVVSLVAGQTLVLQANQTSAGAKALSTSGGLSFLSIYRLP